jgi:DEAD/DEAH box helicase domain-containing protein
LEFGSEFNAFSVALLQGFPGSIISLREKSARIGRTGGASLVVLITQPNALDAYFASHLEELITREPEWLSTSSTNETVLKNHLACAAYELPLRETDQEPWSLPIELRQPFLRATRSLLEEEIFAYRGDRYYYLPQELPHRNFTLRNGSRIVRIVDRDGQIIGSSDDLRAPSTLYPGAQYLHLGRTYDVVEFDQEAGIVTVSLANVQRRTHAIVEMNTEIESIADLREIDGIQIVRGSALVQNHVVGYRSRATGGREISFPVELQPTIHHCNALWITFPTTLRDHLTPQERYRSLHTLEHVVLALAPLIGLFDQGDVNAMTLAESPLWGSPRFQGGTILLYERQGQESGLMAAIVTRTSELLDLCYDLIRSCHCTQGCPSCVLSSQCHQRNEDISREEALHLLSLVRSR